MRGLACGARENRDPVVRLLPKQLALITALLKDQRGKLVVRTLGFLHAQDVGLRIVEPAKHVRHAREH